VLKTAMYAAIDEFRNASGFDEWVAEAKAQVEAPAPPPDDATSTP
jgi:hypothetical protein